MTKRTGIGLHGWVLLALLLPSCSSSRSASDVASSSYVRPPDRSASAIASRRLDPAPLAPTRYQPSNPSPASAGAGMDAQMQKVAASAQVASPFPWRYVVIHHSASSSGGAEAFGRAHKQRGWDGLGYHFVVGNGTGSGDGEIEVGYRWRQQSQGAHAGSFQYNRYGIGICLVGNFDRTRPTGRQLGNLERLVAWLMNKFRIPAANVIEHRDVRQTECPGRNFPLSTVVAEATRLQRQLGSAALAARKAPAQPGAPTPAPSGDADFAQRPAGGPFH